MEKTNFSRILFAMNLYPKVSIGVVVYKGEKYLSQSLSSLFSVNYPGEVEFLLLDYGPDFSAVEEVKKYIPEEKKKAVHLFKSQEKMWHSGGHNYLIRKAKGEYYLCASNDMFYDSNFLTPLVEALEKNSHFSSATGKLLFWDFENGEKTTRIDSLGMTLSSAQICTDIAQGKDESEAPTQIQEIFGASGALVLYKKHALKKVAHASIVPAQYFDEILHYKDDVDLAYRLQWAGQRSLFVPDSRTWHHRQLAKKTKKTKFDKENSTLGNIVFLYKNFIQRGFSFSLFLKTALWFLPLSFFRNGVSIGWTLFMSEKEELSRKKRDMPRNVSAQHFEKFFQNSFLPYKEKTR